MNKDEKSVILGFVLLLTVLCFGIMIGGSWQY